MTTDPLRAISTRRTPQSQPADARQSRNNAGGYAFTVSPLQRLRRFLVLGVEGGTYHVYPRALAQANARVVAELCEHDPRTLVDTIVDVSERGVAPRPGPALFALAMACSLPDDAEARRYALDAVPRVARTGTHLFNFLDYVQQFRGWGRGLRRAVSSWYLAPDVEHVAYQAVKYRQRDGWTHRDVLRLAHPQPRAVDPSFQARHSLFDWICGRGVFLGHGPDMTVLPRDEALRIVEGYERARHVTGGREAAQLVREYGLPWEALPTDALAHAVVWETLLERGLPQTALLRQLPRLTRLGLLTPLGQWTPRVVAQLASVERLARARVHPLAVLNAARVYARGRSDRGSSSWTPSRPIVDALDAAFYAAFGAVTPTGTRTLLALDVSGSMGHALVANTALTARDASAALALVTASVEDRYELVGFTAGDWQSGRGALTPLAISSGQRLTDAVRVVSNLPFGRTDCALPMRYALETGTEVDTFVIYTDNETWHGSVHPHQALRAYRERTGIPARLVVVGMTSTGFTIADPTDPLSLDVVGFDTGTPELLSSFARGEV